MLVDTVRSSGHKGQAAQIGCLQWGLNLLCASNPLTSKLQRASLLPLSPLLPLEMTAVLIKSKLLILWHQARAASQRGGLLPRDRKSPADEAERGRGGAYNIAPASPLVPCFASAAPAFAFFGSRYQMRGQEICVDSLQNNLNLPRDGPVQSEAQRVS